jgi:hypothetical protein
MLELDRVTRRAETQFGTGDNIETSKAHVLTAGGSHFLSGKDDHRLVAKSQAVAQVNGSEPFD